MNYFRLKSLFTLFLFSIPSIVHSQQNVKIKAIGEVTTVNLEQDFAYYFFEANQDFLAWYEGYTSTLFIYDIDISKVNKIALSEGRGPNEFKKITGLSIYNNIIYLTDHTNAKFIRVNSSGEFMEDLVPSNGLQPMKMVSDTRYQVIMEAFGEAVFYSKKSENEKYQPLTLNGTNLMEEFPSLYQKEGYLSIQNGYLIHLARYYPFMYIYDLAENKLEKKIIFDVSEVEEVKSLTTEGGAKMTHPPAKVDILNQDVSSIPGSPDRFFLLAKGKSKTREYGLNKLFEYDFIKEAFVAEHDLDLKAKEIAVNDKYLFVYSDDDYKIYQYEILSN